VVVCGDGGCCGGGRGVGVVGVVVVSVVGIVCGVVVVGGVVGGGVGVCVWCCCCCCYSLLLLDVVLPLLVVLVCGGYAAMETKRKVAGRGKVPTWGTFFFATMLMAWIAGVAMGDANFFLNLRPFYDISNLGTYLHIDPSLFRGQQLMDAGRIIFTNDTRLDLKRAMSFRNQEMYCVAPISIARENGSFETLRTYDFWAVGVGCCSGSNPDFHCGEFNNPSARGGLRLMRDSDRAFFRLAVQQAEAAYNIKAAHPLFFTWMQDPIAEVNAYHAQGSEFFLIGVFSHLVFQSFLVAAAAMVFSKLGGI